MEDAETHAIVGQCAEARSEVAAGLELSRDNSTLERASRALALCGAGRRGAEPVERTGEAVSGRDADDSRVAAGHRRGAGASSAASRRAALELLEPVRPYDHAPSSEFWPAYLRGQAYLQLKDGAAAAAEFQSILDHRGEVPASVLYPLAHLGLARAAMLSRRSGNGAEAYDAFFALWKDADPDLRPLKDARREHSRLR